MVEINFGPSSYSQYTPGVPWEDTVISVPESKDLSEYQGLFSEDNTKKPVTHVEETYDKRPSVTIYDISRIGSDDSYALVMVWVDDMHKWVAFNRREWRESCTGEDWDHDGPYKLELHHGAKILEAYKVPEGKLPAEEVLHTPPSKLEELATGN